MSAFQPRNLSTTALMLCGLAGCKGCKNEDDKGTPSDDSAEIDLCPDFTNDWGQWLSLGVMPDGTPAAAAYDRTKGGLSFALRNEDGEWCHEEADGYAGADGLDPGDRGAYASMAIASDGTVWVGEQDLKGHSLRYAMRDTAGVWTAGIADSGGGAAPDAGYWASLALDAKGAPVIAHYDKGKGALRIAHWGGTAFSAEVVDEGSDVTDDSGTVIEADVGSYANLVIANGTEYIAYYDGAAGALKLAIGTSGAYSTEVVDDTADVGAWPDMLVDDQGNITIAYQDLTNQDLKLAQGTPGAFTLSVVEDGEYRGADAALFMNGTYPAIVSFDGRDNNILLSQEAGGTWTTDTLAGDDAALGYHNEVIEAGGVHYVGCYDYTNRSLWFEQLD